MAGDDSATTVMPDAERGRAAAPGAGMPPVVEVVDVSKSYGAATALRGVSLALGRGEIHGLCGHNGAGKSTLVKFLAGLERPDSGQLRVAGHEVELNSSQDAQRAGIAVVDQELSLLPELTVAENVTLGNVRSPHIRLKRRDHAFARRALERVGLDHISPGRSVAELSIGERQLVEIARMLGRDANVLILDEPTATLTDAEIERVFGAIRSVVEQGASVIFVSHRLGEVLSLCHRVTVLRDGELVGTRPVAELTRGELVDMMLGGLQEDDPLEQGERNRSDKAGLSVRGLGVDHRVRDFEIDARRGTIVGLAGQVGSGASEILRALAGLEPDCVGAVRVHERALTLGSAGAAHRAGVHYVSNDRKSEGLLLSQSIESNLVLTRLRALTTVGVLRRRRIRDEARRLAQLVGVDARRLTTPVRALSGGNQQKVLVGRCLDRPRLDVLLLDEPTRGVDVGGRAEIHHLLRVAAASGATVVFASSELDEILELSDEIITLYGGRIVSRRPATGATANAVLRDMTHHDPSEAAA